MVEKLLLVRTPKHEDLGVPRNISEQFAPRRKAADTPFTRIPTWEQLNGKSQFTNLSEESPQNPVMPNFEHPPRPIIFAPDVRLRYPHSTPHLECGKSMLTTYRRAQFLILTPEYMSPADSCPSTLNKISGDVKNPGPKSRPTPLCLVPPGLFLLQSCVFIDPAKLGSRGPCCLGPLGKNRHGNTFHLPVSRTSPHPFQKAVFFRKAVFGNNRTLQNPARAADP